MDSLAAGLSMGRLSSHRPSPSLDHVPRIIAQSSVHDDVSSASDTSSRRSSSLASPRWRASSRIPAPVRAGMGLGRTPDALPPAPAPAPDSRGRPCAGTRPGAGIGSPGPAPMPHAIDGDRAAGRHAGQDDQGPSSTDAGLAQASDDQHGADAVADQQGGEEWSANARQLIEETERAFEAVGNALNDAHLASWLIHVPGPSAPSPVVPTSPPSGDHHRRDGYFPRKPASRSASDSTSPGKRRRRELRSAVARPDRLPAKAIRSVLAASVTSVLLGQRFKRVVADEMLTPARIEELKRSREQKADDEAKLLLDCRRASSGSSRSSDASAEPFHLEGLVSRIDAAAQRAMPALVDAALGDVLSGPSTAPLDDAVVRCDFSLPVAEASSASVIIDSFAFPVPPPRNPARHASRAHLARLPTIPDVLTATSDEAARTTPPLPRADHEDEDDELIYLESPPLSSANRSFRHGPIAFPKPETGRDEAAGEDSDKAVDWTAFQMAILGGAGDLSSGMYEDDQRQLADDMAEWFEAFGFETHGQLIADSGRSPRDSSSSSSPSTVNSDTELPIPVHSERPAPDGVRFLRSGVRPQRPDASKRCGLRPPRVVGGEALRDVSEGAAMACNFERDLDDFLRCEDEYAHGGVL